VRKNVTDHDRRHPIMKRMQSAHCATSRIVLVDIFKDVGPRINEGSYQGDKRAILLVVIGLTRWALAQLLGAKD
jgi:hypothetical protein